MDLNSLDIGILALIFVSILISVYRGFLRETLSIVTIIIASAVAYIYGKDAATLFHSFEAESTRNLLGASSVFVLVVLVGFIIKFIVCKAFNIGGPSGLDRILGAVFGLVRGLAIVIVVMLVSPETIQEPKWYKESKLVPKLKGMADMVDSIAPKGWKDDFNKEMEQFYGTKGAAAAAPTTAATPITKPQPMFPETPVTSDQMDAVPPAPEVPPKSSQ